MPKTKPTHTPGPWIVTRSSFANAFEVVARHPGVDHLPRSTGEIVLAHPAPLFNGKEQEANARLIAVAPELLEGARFALKGLEFLSELIAQANVGAVGDGYLKAIPALRAVIAKAEGS